MNTDSRSSSPEAPLPVVALFGPTAVGKTALLSSLAPDTYEIINADSRQVYRGLDIGTAKPDAALRSRLPHHLIDLVEPEEQFTSGRFVREADRLVAEISARGRFPIVAGGTGYYLRSFVFGLPETPGAFPGIRRKLTGEMRSRGVGALHRELALVDPITASRVAAHDRYRIERALEVFRGTGRPLSSFAVPTSPRRRYRFLLICLELPRSELYRRIDLRVREMFDSGLVREVAELVSRGYREDAPALSSIGYAELLAMRRHGCTTIAETMETVCRNTRRYAKRQLTLFRALPDVTRLSPAQSAEALRLIEDHFAVKR